MRVIWDSKISIRGWAIIDRHLLFFVAKVRLMQWSFFIKRYQKSSHSNFTLIRIQRIFHSKDIQDSADCNITASNFEYKMLADVYYISALRLILALLSF